MTALVPDDHSEIVPSSVTKINLPPANTVPVGLPGPVPLAGGMVTTSGTAVPVPSYKVETPFPLSETHQGVVEPRDSPQGLTRFASVKVAGTNPSETRLVW